MERKYLRSPCGWACKTHVPPCSGVAALCKLQRKPKSQEVIISNSQLQVLNYSVVTIEEYSQL